MQSTSSPVSKPTIEAVKDLQSNFTYTEHYILNLNDHLTQISSQYNNWIIEIRQLLSTYKENRTQLDKYDKEINHQMKKEKNLMTKLSNEQDKMLSHLSIKIPKKTVDQLLLSGRELALDAKNEIASIESNWLSPLNDITQQIKTANISYAQAKELIEKIIAEVIVSDDILREFNEDYYNAKKWEYTSIEILNEKKIDMLQSQIEAFGSIKYIKDNTLTNLHLELCEFKDKMVNLQESSMIAIANVNDIKELEDIKELLKKNNVNNGDLLKEIEEKIMYLNHMSDLFFVKQYSKGDLKTLRERLIKYGLINDSLHNEINLKLNLIENCSNLIQQQLLSPITDSESKFTLEDMETICNTTKQNNILIDNGDILDICKALWKLNEEYEVNSTIIKIGANEEQLGNLIKRYPNNNDSFINSRYNMKIKELRHKILLSKGNILLSSKHSIDNKPKLCLNDIQIFFTDVNDLNNCFDTIYVELMEEQRNELKTALVSIKHWSDNYTTLHNEVFSNQLINADKAKAVLLLLKSTKDSVISYIDLSHQLTLFNDIEQLLLLNEDILNYININKSLNENESLPPKPSITQLKASFDEYTQRIKSNCKLKSLALLQEEITKIDSWLEHYYEYQTKKRKRLYDQIDLTLLETMLNESQAFICNIITEQSSISTDLNATKHFYDVSSKLLADSDPFSYQHTQLPQNSINDLNQIISDLNSNKVLISDKSIIDNIKALDWCIRIQTAMSSQVEYQTINKLHQEGIQLKRYNDIQRQGYIQSVLSQISLAKNYKELSDLITKTKQKQISEEEFDSIISEYNSKCRIVFIEEKEVIDSIIKMRLDYESQYENYYTNKAGLHDYEKLLNDISKFPIRLDGLIAKIDDVIVVTKLLQREVKKLYEQKVKSKLQLTQDKVYHLVDKCKKNNATFPEGDQLIKAYNTCISNMKKLKEMINDPNSDLYEMIELKEDITIHCNNADENEISKVIWKRKYEELIVNSRPTQLMIEHLLSEIKEISIEADDKDSNEVINALRELHNQSDDYIEKIGQCCNMTELNTLKSEIGANCKVDLSQYIVEQETKLNLKILPSKVVMNQRKKKEALMVNREKSNREDNSSSNNNNGLPENIKLVSNELNETSGVNTVEMRSKRNIKRKINNDYFYEKEFVDNFENKIAVRNQTEEIKDTTKEEVISGTENKVVMPIIESKQDVNVDIKEKDKDKEKDKEKEKPNIIEQKDISARIETMLLHKKTKRPTEKTSNQQRQNTPEIDQLKLSIQKNTRLQFENICRENPVFFKEGSGFICNLAKKLEDELSNAYPKIDADYQKVLANMLKTVKELEKFKKVSTLVVKGKVTLFKVAKFPYGPKYIQKLEGIEDSVKKKKESKKEEETIQTLFTGVKELYSSLSGPIKPKEEKKERLISINASLAQDDEEGDNSSLKSLSEKENIRFSPGKGILNKNKALTTSTTIQSTLSPQKQSANEKNEKLYDPFNNEDMLDSFAHKRKKFIYAIFYDPERQKLLKEITHPDITSQVPVNSILKIWNGKLVINKSELNNVSFLSTNEYSLFELFPQLAPEVIISNRAKTNEVIPYVEKQLNNKQKVVVYGWLEIDSNNSEKYISLAEEYDKHDRCACLIIHNVKLYIFSLSQKYPKFNANFRNECYFYNDVLMSQMDKLLVFVLIANKSDLVDVGKRITPVVLKRKEITITQDNINMSPITSEDENDNENEKEGQEHENENDKLEKLLQTNDFKLFDEYVLTNFNNLSQSEIAEKFLQFDEEKREKLSMLINQYQMNCGRNQEGNINDNENIEGENDNVNMNNENGEVGNDNPNKPMEIDSNSNENNDMSNQDGMDLSVQKRIEEVINEEQMRRMSQLNQMQMQQNPTPLIPPYFNSSMMNSNPSMYPPSMMNDYNQMMMQQQSQQFNQRGQNQNQHPYRNQYQHQRQQYNYHQQNNKLQRYSNNNNNQ